jgi:pimeloyl-ACP methyl ester carboxylesterase
MPSFSHDGVEIAFLDEGEGEPIVLVHGFASNKEVNWVEPGWVSMLKRAARRVIALDNRGQNFTIRPPITAPSWPTTCAR